MAKKEFITFGIDKLEENMFTNISCGVGLKPEGGLYAYPLIDDGKYLSPFEKWCDEEFINRGMLRSGIKYNISSSASIYVVNGWADLHNLLQKFPLLKTIEGVEGMEQKIVADVGIDYAEVAKKYDAIYLSPKGVVNTDLKNKHIIDVREEKLLKKEERRYQTEPIEINTSGWEVSCYCIFNPKIIQNIVRFKNPNLHLLDENETFDEMMKELNRGTKKEDLFKIFKNCYMGNQTIDKLIDGVVDTKKVEKRFHSLMNRLKGLLEVQINGSISLDSEIEATAKNIYSLTLEKEGFEEFQTQLKKALETGILGDIRGKAQDVTEAIADAMLDDFI